MSMIFQKKIKNHDYFMQLLTLYTNYKSLILNNVRVLALFMKALPYAETLVNVEFTENLKLFCA